MTKSQFMKKAASLNITVEDTSTSGTWAVRMFEKGITNPGKVNVARLNIPHTKDLFWDACAESLNTYF